jgi:hypothetical protein
MTANFRRDADGFNIALRVLARLIYRGTCSPRDIDALRRKARPDEMELPVEELCCRVLQRALSASPARPPLRPRASA